MERKESIFGDNEIVSMSNVSLKQKQKNLSRTTKAIAMRHSFRTKLLFGSEVGFLGNDILSFHGNNIKPCQNC